MEDNFKGKKIVVMGLGLLGGGVGAAKFFCKKGADVLVTDLRTKRELSKSLQKLKRLKIKYVLGGHKKEDFEQADFIIKNPAVPPNSFFLDIARKNRIPIETDISVFFDLCPCEIIGITGTKGKSTTATLIYLFLKKKYPHSFLAGNIGVSPLEILPKIKKSSKVVLELSSFELEDLKKSPHVAIITCLFPDHLNRYRSFKEYVKSKKSIFKYQKESDILILNSGDSETKKLSKEAKSKVKFFDGSNVSAAVAAAEIFEIPKKNIKKVLSNFKGVPSRQEFITEKVGIKYFNDTTATTPNSVILAIGTFKKRFPKSRIILIAGGQDKNLDYSNLAKEIKSKADYLVLLPGTASDKLKKELGNFKKVSGANSMAEALEKARSIAKRGDIVLLSPGAASFNIFKNEFDRGEQFNKIVKKHNEYR